MWKMGPVTVKVLHGNGLRPSIFVESYPIERISFIMNWIHRLAPDPRIAFVLLCLQRVMIANLKLRYVRECPGRGYWDAIRDLVDIILVNLL